MVFSSLIFLFAFLPVVLGVYYVLKPGLRNAWLLIASLFFYAWGEPKNVLVMIFSILLNYFLVLLIEALKQKKILQNIVFVFIIMVDVGILFYFKYIDFFIRNLNFFFKTDFVKLGVALPIGISFYTFQILSYVIDVKRDNVPVQRNILDLGLYISLFPQLIAGPIVRYVDVNNQIKKRTVDLDGFYSGIMRFMKGFSKKVLIADVLSVYVNTIFSQDGISALSAWMGAITYTLQIYFDFSGYSDMAIGLGRMFGFEFLENFNFPYTSKSVNEFWRRWHISLSTWFRDYIYIPLGGSRKGDFRTYLNLLVVWILTGFWHGASYNFIFWGLYYFGFLVLERLFLGKGLKKIPVFFQHLYALLIIVIGWVFFRADGLEAGLTYIGNLFNFNDGMWKDFIYVLDRKFVFFLIVGIVCSVPMSSKIQVKYGKIIEAVKPWAILIVFMIAIAYLWGSGFSPFLYFRF